MGRRKKDGSTKQDNTREGKTPRVVFKPKNQAPKKRYTPYSSEEECNLKQIIADIQEGKISIRKAVQQYGYSYGFIHRRVTGEVGINRRNGPAPTFSREEEVAMAQFLKEMAERDMGVKASEFFDSLQNIILKEKRETNFKDGRPSFDWFRSFKDRTADVVDWKLVELSKKFKTKPTRTIMDQWYSKFRDFLVQKNLADKPNLIWNADEVGFRMGNTFSKVTGPCKFSESDDLSKQYLTVMFCGAADGSVMPPFFVYPKPKLKGENPSTGPIEHSVITYSNKGQMNATIMQEFIQHFDMFAGKQRPVLLLIDSVKAHVSMSVFGEAKACGIELYGILPNASHLMQPLDKGLFGRLQKKWQQVAETHTNENPGSSIDRDNFAGLLNGAFLMSCKTEKIADSFKSTGICPVNGSAIVFENVDGTDISDTIGAAVTSLPTSSIAADLAYLACLNCEAEETVTTSSPKPRIVPSAKAILKPAIQGLSGADVEKPVYSVLETGEGYEQRHYLPAKWVSTIQYSVSRESAVNKGFRQLFNYISGENDKGIKMDMTAPVVTRIEPGVGLNCESTFTISFYIPSIYQSDPPEPLSEDVFIDDFPELTLYVMAFGGFASEGDWLNKARELSEKLQDKDLNHEFYFTAAYDSSFRMFNRLNEVWFMKK